MKSIGLCVNRFDQDTKEAFLDLYSKVDVTVTDGSETTTSETDVQLDDILEDALNG